MHESTVEPLILDLLQWIWERVERPYEEVMEAWRTSCPRLPVWEDANDRGLVTTKSVDGRSVVKVTPRGLALLARRRLFKSGYGRRHRPQPRSSTTDPAS